MFILLTSQFKILMDQSAPIPRRMCTLSQATKPKRAGTLSTSSGPPPLRMSIEVRLRRQIVLWMLTEHRRSAPSAVHRMAAKLRTGVKGR